MPVRKARTLANAMAGRDVSNQPDQYESTRDFGLAANTAHWAPRGPSADTGRAAVATDKTAASKKTTMALYAARSAAAKARPAARQTKARSMSPQRTATGLSAAAAPTVLQRGPTGELVAARTTTQKSFRDEPALPGTSRTTLPRSTVQSFEAQISSPLSAGTRLSTRDLRSASIQDLRAMLASPSPISQASPSPKSSPAAKSRILMGAHYDPVSEELTDNYTNADREDHDEMLADSLHKRRPSDVPHPAVGSPRAPTHSAFTDRAGRRCEGRALKKVLMHDSHSPTDWFSHGACFCAVCKPNLATQAGAASHEMPINKVPLCHRDVPTSPTQDGSPHASFDSSRIAQILVGATPHEHAELQFSRALGRRGGSPARRAWSPGASGVLQHRSMSDDNLLAAGRFNQDFRPEISACSTKTRQCFQGSSRDGEVPRSGAALVLSPREGDPPAPTQIGLHSRAGGTFKYGPTRQSEKISCHQNQSVFRFASPDVVHGRNSAPPDYDSHCGTTTEGFRARHLRQNPASPKRSPRALLGSNSALMAGIMNQDLGADFFAHEAECRAMTDTPFVNMCSLTAEHKRTQRSLGAAIKETCGQIPGSSNVAQHLTWEE